MLARLANNKHLPITVLSAASYDYHMMLDSIQVGACIVSQDNIILGIGYNGFPRGCPDDKLPWSKQSHDGDVLCTKYPYVCHAELNAVLNKNTASLRGAVCFGACA